MKISVKREYYFVPYKIEIEVESLREEYMVKALLTWGTSKYHEMASYWGEVLLLCQDIKEKLEAEKQSKK